MNKQAFLYNAHSLPAYQSSIVSDFPRDVVVIHFNVTQAVALKQWSVRAPRCYENDPSYHFLFPPNISPFFVSL